MSRWLDSSMRRLIDVSVAVSALVVLAPLIALVALAVRLGLGSPVLFRQERAGRGGAPFAMTKFRTMREVCDSDGSPLPDAHRLPAFGRLVRQSSLDELPQLWHVVRGDMSLIGPRPLPVRYTERYSHEQRRRLVATPGMTGWAQVQGRNALSWADRLRLDVKYVENASPRLDAWIIWLTLLILVTGKGVNAGGRSTMPEFTGTT